MIAQYKKKPVTIDALQFTKHNLLLLVDFCKHGLYNQIDNTFIIPTLEGNMTASVGDYIIKGVQGEFYPCKPDIFEMTYEKVTD